MSKLYLAASNGQPVPVSVSARSLISEARSSAGQLPVITELVLNPPEALAVALDMLLEDFDYRANPTSDRALVCRIIAALVHVVDTKPKCSPAPKIGEQKHENIKPRF